MDGTNRTAERAAGWYPDPQDGSRYRWWDGTAWTDQTSVPFDAPAGSTPQPASPQEEVRPEPEPAPQRAPVRPTPEAEAQEDESRSGRRWLLAVVAAVVLIGTGAAGGVMLVGGDSDQTETAAASSAEASDAVPHEGNAGMETSAPASESDAETSEDEGAAPDPTPTPDQARSPNSVVATDTWTVVLESLETDRYPWHAAEESAEWHAANGVRDVGVIRSSDYGSLNPGYWVVVAGSWPSEEDAASYCRQIRNIAESCYQRFVGDASPAGAASGSSNSLDDAVSTVASKDFEPIDTTGYDPNSTLQVIVGMASGSADGYTQQAFFFVEGDYIGTDTLEPSATIGLAWQDDTTVALTYALYDPDDPMCCPTGEATVRYRWNGSKLEPLDPIPPMDWEAYGSRR